MEKQVLRLERERKKVFELEDFIHSISFLEDTEKDKILLISSEIFDNILDYSKPRKSINSKVVICIRKTKLSTSVMFLFHSTNFELFVENINKKKIYYNDELKRYRGLGIIMCYNLSSSLSYRLTKNYNAIRVRI